ncbi:MAG: NUDIX domain-containing protein [Pseudomonadales bacterium]|nr:NUDIX domain-containing protein [Pseudomonadales bacterium]
MRFRSRYKTARCVLKHEDEFFLAVHSSFWARKERRWGLPGGGIERREDPEYAVRRELEEELELYVATFTEVGPYRYKGNDHMVFGAEIDIRVDTYDDTELLDIGWYNLSQIKGLDQSKRLHAGYELQAIEAYLEKI